MAQPLKQVLHSTLQRLNLLSQLPSQLALLYWDEKLAPTISGGTAAGRVKEGTLFVKVASPTLRADLTLRKHQYLEKLNQILQKHKGEPVKEIKFVYQAGQDFSRSQKPPEDGLETPWLELELDKTEKAQISKLAAGVKDKALRSKVKAFLTKEFQLQKWMKDSQTQA